jgi:hypothetical protein
MLCLLHGSAHPALGIDDDLEYLAKRLRAVWPDVEIHIRADSGFGVPVMYDACERLDLLYTIGLKLNNVLKCASQPLLDEALENYARTDDPQRIFRSYWYRAKSWFRDRLIVVKAEANAHGTNRRVIITNRPGAVIFSGACYDEHVQRGESENRNKELKCGLKADRLSDHRYLANLFRLYLHAAAANLLVLMRREIADPPPQPHPPIDAAEPVPFDALPKKQRQRYYNQRCKEDPLGEGHPCTWRTRLIKVAGHIVVRARRVRVYLPAHWPYLEHFRRVSEAVLQIPSQILLSPD